MIVTHIINVKINLFVTLLRLVPTHYSEVIFQGYLLQTLNNEVVSFEYFKFEFKFEYFCDKLEVELF